MDSREIDAKWLARWFSSKKREHNVIMGLDPLPGVGSPTPPSHYFADFMGREIKKLFDEHIAALSTIGPGIVRLRELLSWAMTYVDADHERGMNLPTELALAKEAHAILSAEPAQPSDIAGEVWDMLVDHLMVEGRTKLYDDMRKRFPIVTEPAQDDGKPEVASFEEIKEWIIHSKYNDEYIQAAIVILRKIFNERSDDVKRRIEEAKK